MNIHKFNLILKAIILIVSSCISFIKAENLDHSKMLNLMKEYNTKENYEFINESQEIQMFNNISIKRYKIAKLRINKNLFSKDDYYSIKFHYLDPLGISSIFKLYKEDSEINQNEFLNQLNSLSLANCNTDKNNFFSGNEMLITNEIIKKNIENGNKNGVNKNDFFYMYFTFCIYPLDVSSKESKLNQILFSLEIIKSYSDNRLLNILFDKNLFSITTFLAVFFGVLIVFFFNDCEDCELKNQSKQSKLE